MKDATTVKSATKPRKARAPKPYQPTGPKTLQGSDKARKSVAVVLEVLTGIRGPQDGADALGITLSRYYAIETRGLQGMLTALEPRPRGRVLTPAREIERLRQETTRLSRDVERGRAVLRALERTVGVTKSLPPTGPKRGTIGGRHGNKKPRMRRRTVVRAERAIAALRDTSDPSSTSTSETGGSS